MNQIDTLSDRIISRAMTSEHRRYMRRASQLIVELNLDSVGYIELSEVTGPQKISIKPEQAIKDLVTAVLNVRQPKIAAAALEKFLVDVESLHQNPDDVNDEE